MTINFIYFKIIMQINQFAVKDYLPEKTNSAFEGQVFFPHLV